MSKTTINVIVLEAAGGLLLARRLQLGKLAKFADQARGRPGNHVYWEEQTWEWLPFRLHSRSQTAMPRRSVDGFAVRVYYEDTDSSGRVYHASYLRFLERGRTEWLRGHGFTHQDFAESSGIVFAVRTLQIDYLSPALMDDLLRVETDVSAFRGASIEFRQRIFRDEKELVAATVLVAAIHDGRPARIPAALRRLLQAPR